MTPFALAFDFGPALPEMTLLAAACIVLVVDLFLPDSRRAWGYWLTQTGLLVAAWFALMVFHEEPAHALGKMFVADALADVLRFFSYVSVWLLLLYSRG